MRIVLQRVSSASVKVDGAIIGQIGQGYVALLGIGNSDNRETVDKMVEKIEKLRLFPDSHGKTNLSISDINGELLVISQFTLYADCRKGTRPSFTEAAPPSLAKELYEYFIEKATLYFQRVACGVFAADMQVELTNNGPFTVVLEG